MLSKTFSTEHYISLHRTLPNFDTSTLFFCVHRVNGNCPVVTYKHSCLLVTSMPRMFSADTFNIWTRIHISRRTETGRPAGSRACTLPRREGKAVWDRMLGNIGIGIVDFRFGLHTLL